MANPNCLLYFSQKLVLYRDHLLLEEEFGDGLVLDGKESVQENTTQSKKSVMINVKQKREKRTKIETEINIQ